jgi:hypothetical protein
MSQSGGPPGGQQAPASAAAQRDARAAQRGAQAAALAAARTVAQTAAQAATTTQATLAQTPAAAGAPHAQAQQAATAAAAAAAAAAARVTQLEQAEAAAAAADGGDAADGASIQGADSDDARDDAELQAMQQREAQIRAQKAQRAARAAAASAPAAAPSLAQQVATALAESEAARQAAQAARRGGTADEAAAAEAVAEAAERRTAAALAAASAAAAEQLARRDAQRSAQQAGHGAKGAQLPLAVPLASQVGFPPPLQRGGFGAVSGVGASGAALIDAAQLASAMSVLKSIPLAELTAAEASKAGVLEDWLYRLRNVLEAGGVSDFTTQLKVLGVRIDRQLAVWLAGATELARVSGAPFRSLEDVAAAMRGQFTPQSDEETAWRELIGVKQRGSERMEEYVARAQDLYNRVSRGRLPAEMAGELLIHGVDGRRFPFTVRTLRGAQRTNRTVHGVGLTFENARAQLVAEAADEPQLGMIQAATPTRTGGSGSSSGKAPYRGPSSKVSGQQHINSVSASGSGGNRYASLGEETTDEGEGDGGVHGLNALDLADVKCFRCQQNGHYAADCSRPETRICNNCKKKGHLKRDCRAKKASNTPGGPASGGSRGGGGEGQALQAGTQQKNGEARG